MCHLEPLPGVLPSLWGCHQGCLLPGICQPQGGHSTPCVPTLIPAMLWGLSWLSPHSCLLLPCLVPFPDCPLCPCSVWMPAAPGSATGSCTVWSCWMSPFPIRWPLSEWGELWGTPPWPLSLLATRVTLEVPPPAVPRAKECFVSLPPSMPPILPAASS